MHYYNPSLTTGIKDSSGVRVTFATQLRTYDAVRRHRDRMWKAMDPMWKTSGFNEENDPNQWIRFGWVFEELWMVILSQ